MKNETRQSALAFLLLGALLPWSVTGCAPSEEVTSESAPTGESAEETTDKSNMASLEPTETIAVLVLPAPSEIADAVREDIDLDLQAALAQPLPEYEGLPEWRQSLALGQVVADLLIGMPEASPEQIVLRLDNISDGLRSLGLSEQQLSELESLRSEVASGAIGQDALIDRFDRLRVEVLRRGKAEVGDQTMALIATGGWARAVSLIAGHIQESGEIPDRARALKLRPVVAVLIDRIGTEGPTAPVVESLQAILPLTELSPSAPTSEELATLIRETDEILALTRAG